MGGKVDRISQYIAKKICSSKFAPYELERRKQDRISMEEIRREINFLKEQGMKLYRKELDEARENCECKEPVE